MHLKMSSVNGGHFVSASKSALRKRHNTSCYHISCTADIWRAVPRNSGAGTSSYWVVTNAAIQISSIFHGTTDLVPGFCGNVFVIFHRLIWEIILLLHSGCSIVSRVSISAVILTTSFSNFAKFRQMHIQTCKRNITRLYNDQYGNTISYTTGSEYCHE